MKKYGGKTVVAVDEFAEGLVVEFREGNPTEVVCREYYKENGELQVENEMYTIDIFRAINKDTPCKQMKEIADQLGTDEFYISQDVINILES